MNGYREETPDRRTNETDEILLMKVLIFYIRNLFLRNYTLQDTKIMKLRGLSSKTVKLFVYETNDHAAQIRAENLNARKLNREDSRKVRNCAKINKREKLQNRYL